MFFWLMRIGLRVPAHLEQYALSRSQRIPGQGKRRELSRDGRKILKLLWSAFKFWPAKRGHLQVFVDDHHPARPIFVGELADDELFTRFQPAEQVGLAKAVVAFRNFADVIDVIAAQI